MIRQFFARKQPKAPAIPPHRRVYAIGDVHGRLDLLDTLLAMIRADQTQRSPIEPEIVMLGDLIDRGLESAGVVQRMMDPPNWACFTMLMGNHEAAMLEALQGDRQAMRMWLAVGGRQTLESWGVTQAVLDEGTIEEIGEAAYNAVPRTAQAWIAGMLQSLTIGDYYFVHAGVRPGVELERQTIKDSLWIRDEFLNSRRDHGAIVVHGHSITSEVEEMPNRIGLDTGAYASGRLTALGLEGTDRWFLQTG